MSKQLTRTQIRKQVLEEYFAKDPDFKDQMEAYAKMVDEFGNIKPPVYIAEKLAEINDVVKGRLNSELVQ